MAAETLRERTKLARREVILESAMRHFSERPYDDVSIGDICLDAGVAHGLVSYYFGGKSGLFTATVQKAWDDMLRYERPRDGEVGGPDRIRGYVRRHFEYVRSHAAQFQGLMNNPDVGPPHTREIARSAQREARNHLIASLGCPSKPQPLLRAALQGWAGYLDNITLDWLSNGELDLDGVVEHCIQVLAAVVKLSSGEPLDDETTYAALSLASGG